MDVEALFLTDSFVQHLAHKGGDAYDIDEASTVGCDESHQNFPKQHLTNYL
jgi:hypothetical protein